MTSLITLKRANTACSRLGVRAALFWLFSRLWAFHRFDGESSLPPQAANASRWALGIVNTTGIQNFSFVTNYMKREKL